jgi:hypothetical protein
LGAILEKFSEWLVARGKAKSDQLPYRAEARRPRGGQEIPALFQELRALGVTEYALQLRGRIENDSTPTGHGPDPTCVPICGDGKYAQNDYKPRIKSAGAALHRVGGTVVRPPDSPLTKRNVLLLVRSEGLHEI